MASSKDAPHSSGSMSQSLPSSAKSSCSLFVLDMMNKGKFAERQKRKKCTTEHTAYKIVTWQRGTYYPSSTRVKLFVLLDRRRPSLLPAGRSLLTSGDSCCCCCFWVPAEVCLNGEIFPLSMLLAVASRYCRSISSLTKWRTVTCAV